MVIRETSSRRPFVCRLWGSRSNFVNVLDSGLVKARRLVSGCRLKFPPNARRHPSRYTRPFILPDQVPRPKPDIDGPVPEQSTVLGRRGRTPPPLTGVWYSMRPTAMFHGSRAICSSGMCPAPPAPRSRSCPFPASLERVWMALFPREETRASCLGVRWPKLAPWPSNNVTDFPARGRRHISKKCGRYKYPAPVKEVPVVNPAAPAKAKPSSHGHGPRPPDDGRYQVAGKAAAARNASFPSSPVSISLTLSLRLVRTAAGPVAVNQHVLCGVGHYPAWSAFRVTAVSFCRLASLFREWSGCCLQYHLTSRLFDLPARRRVGALPSLGIPGPVNE